MPSQPQTSEDEGTNSARGTGIASVPPTGDRWRAVLPILGVVVAVAGVIVWPVLYYVQQVSNEIASLRNNDISNLRTRVEALEQVKHDEERQLHELLNFKASEAFGESCQQRGGSFVPVLSSCLIKGGSDIRFSPPYPPP